MMKDYSTVDFYASLRTFYKIFCLFPASISKHSFYKEFQHSLNCITKSLLSKGQLLPIAAFESLFGDLEQNISAMMHQISILNSFNTHFQQQKEESPLCFSFFDEDVYYSQVKTVKDSIECAHINAPFDVHSKMQNQNNHFFSQKMEYISKLLCDSLDNAQKQANDIAMEFVNQAAQSANLVAPLEAELQRMLQQVQEALFTAQKEETLLFSFVQQMDTFQKYTVSAEPHESNNGN